MKSEINVKVRTKTHYYIETLEFEDVIEYQYSKRRKHHMFIVFTKKGIEVVEYENAKLEYYTKIEEKFLEWSAEVYNI